MMAETVMSPALRLVAPSLAAIFTRLSFELLQQGFGVLQVCRVKPLGKPAIHRGEQVVGVLALVLGLPQAGKAGGGTQFPGFGLLGTGHVEGLVLSNNLPILFGYY